MTGNNRDFRDDDLRDRFAALRREEEAQAPQYAVLWPGGAGHGRWPSQAKAKLIAVAVCLVTMVAAVFLLRPVPQKLEREASRPVASLTEWRSPTDFLLETPGRELLRTVPAIGVWHNYTQALRPRQKRPQVRKKVLP